MSLEDKLRQISGLGLGAPVRQFRAGSALVERALCSTPAAHLDDLRERVARQRRAAAADAARAAEVAPVDCPRKRAVAPAGAKPGRTKAGAAAKITTRKDQKFDEARIRGQKVALAANLARLRQDPAFEQNRIVSMPKATSKRAWTPERRAAASAKYAASARASLVRLRQDPAFEPNRIDAIKRAWTPERRAAASKLLARQRKDPAFNAKHSAASRATMLRLRTPEFEARRLAASNAAKKRGRQP